MVNKELPISVVKGYEFNTKYWQNDDRIPFELLDEFNREMAKLAHLQIAAAMTEDSKGVRELADQQNIVYSVARNIAYSIKNG